MSKRINKITGHLARSETSGGGSAHVNSSIVDGLDQNVKIQRSDNPIATLEQLRQFEEDGYFLVKGLLSPADVKKFSDRFEEIAKGEVTVEGIQIIKDIALAEKMKREGRTELHGDHEVFKLQDYENDEVLMSYVKHPKVLAYVKDIIGPEVRSMHTMVINKPPDVGLGTSQHPLHQDLLYFPFRPSNLITASWTALQKIDEENGCLEVVPKSHKFGLFPHAHPEENGNAAYFGVHNDLTAQYEKKFGRVKVNMEPGDTIFFHPCLIHGSGPNLSKRFRLAISCHYASAACDFVGIPDHNYSLLEEIMEMAGRKFKINDYKKVMKDLDKKQILLIYQFIFKNKSRRVAGKNDLKWAFTDEELEEINKLLSNKRNI